MNTDTSQGLLESGVKDDTYSETDLSDAHAEIADLLDDRDLLVVSNRQSYSHEYEDGSIVATQNAGGLTAALDPLMREVSGTWVAWGSGEADREAADESGLVSLPPDEESYDLQRVWLDDGEVDGYYLGYSNRVLWPVCHADTAKVDVRPADWETYREVNERFAERTIERATEDAIVWFQDYHLAVAPRAVRAALPDAFLAHFWHIPWPPWDVFRVCPHHEAVLRGLLANDLFGCQTYADCQNFLNCVETAGIGGVDRVTGSVVLDGQRTYVRSFPVGPDAERWAILAASPETERFRASLRDEYELSDRHVAVGVERLDYTKGIERRLDALEYLWEERPDLRDDLTYIQKISASREEIPAYRQLRDRIDERIDGLNERFGTDDWDPIVYLSEYLSREKLTALYCEADLALVTPVRDGMNLVAKEFVAAQRNDPGVLVLSERAGASEQLSSESVLVNPYDVAGMAETIAESLTMPAEERRDRMNGLQENVRRSDVYAWMIAQFRTVDEIDTKRHAADELLT